MRARRSQRPSCGRIHSSAKPDKLDFEKQTNLPRHTEKIWASMEEFRGDGKLAYPPTSAHLFYARARTDPKLFPHPATRCPRRRTTAASRQSLSIAIREKLLAKSPRRYHKLQSSSGIGSSAARNFPRRSRTATAFDHVIGIR